MNPFPPPFKIKTEPVHHLEGAGYEDVSTAVVGCRKDGTMIWMMPLEAYILVMRERSPAQRPSSRAS